MHTPSPSAAGRYAIASRDQCVIPHLIACRALANPERPFAVFEDDNVWTNADTYRVMLRAACGLRRLGVRRGDRVLSWLPTGRDALRVWFGANQLGAIYVPINPAYRGALLQRVLTNAAPVVAVVHADLLPRLEGLDLGELKHVVVVGKEARSLPGVHCHVGSILDAEDVDQDARTCPAEPWDPYAIIYTSGTTGPSKGVVSSYVHVWASGVLSFGHHLGPNDRNLINLPLHHAAGTIAVAGALAQGASIALPGEFDTQRFWDMIRRTGTTICTLVGAMATFLLKQPVLTDDRDNPLRLAAIIPLIENASVFAERFGCDVYTAYNMTEINCPLVSDLNPRVAGSCGRPRAGVEVRLVDSHDRDVPTGEAGELIMRADMPWSLASGYWRDPQATMAVWRNGWFHTADLFKQDVQGNFFFVDRLKDAIRRRGENISSFEVEAELLAYPHVREAAVVAVPSPQGEDDVLAVVAPVPGARIDPEALLQFLIDRLAHFMVPRYIRIVERLPKTATNKVEKYSLRSEGVTADTWDREAAGVKVRRERIGGAKQD